MRSHRAVAVVLGLYALSAVVVPTLTAVATTDDWAYARSVEILHDEHRLTIFPVVAATAVFQVVWGALFAALLGGVTFGVVRLSTVAITALGALALYGLCRQLNVDRHRSALGAASYLFNPLSYVLSFSFMTDPHFAALLIVATACYVRGLTTESAEQARSRRWTVLGSAAAGLAFLTRQQGALIPLAVVIYLLSTRKLAPNRAGGALVLRVVALPAIATVGYSLWLRYVNDVPAVQRSFLEEVVDAGWSGTGHLARYMTFFGMMYAGFFAVPLTAGALFGLRRLTRAVAHPGWLLFCAWEAILVAGLVFYGHAGRRMPYLPQFAGSSGLGPPDVLGGRPRLLELGVRDWLTAACAVSAVVLGLLVARNVRPPRRSRPASTVDAGSRAKAGLVLTIGLWQAIGVLPPSYHYIGWAGSLDRYLLPLLPFVVCLGFWAARDLRLALPVAWVVVATFAVYSVAGTRDYLVYLNAVWGLAREANARGIDNTRLDAGSAWDGYHLYEHSLENKIRARTPRGGPWWVYFYAPATDSSYVVAGRALDGYVTVNRRAYSSWLETEPTVIYLLRREGVAGPP